MKGAVLRGPGGRGGRAGRGKPSSVVIGVVELVVGYGRGCTVRYGNTTAC